jgi:hypothetical protein
LYSLILHTFFRYICIYVAHISLFLSLSLSLSLFLTHSLTQPPTLCLLGVGVYVSLICNGHCWFPLSEVDDSIYQAKKSVEQVTAAAAANSFSVVACNLFPRLIKSPPSSSFRFRRRFCPKKVAASCPECFSWRWPL